MADAKKIGLLGGTFNPIHLGHLMMAQDALELFDLDAIWFIPASIPPHKPATDLLANEHRAEMIKRAIREFPNFSLNDIEFGRDGISYSIDTVRELKTRHPGKQFFFVIGGDTLPEIHSWRQPLDLLGEITFITLARPGSAAILDHAATYQLPPPWPEQLRQHIRTAHQIDISSRDIRSRIQAHQTVRHLLPESVYQYITQHKLYL